MSVILFVASIICFALAVGASPLFIYFDEQIEKNAWNKVLSFVGVGIVLLILSYLI